MIRETLRVDRVGFDRWQTRDSIEEGWIELQEAINEPWLKRRTCLRV